MWLTNLAHLVHELECLEEEENKKKKKRQKTKCGKHHGHFLHTGASSVERTVSTVWCTVCTFSLLVSLPVLWHVEH